MTKLEAIDYSVGHCVATIALDRTEARNAMNAALRRELLLAVSRANDDPDVRVVVVTGNGKCFSAGADMREGPPETSAEEQINTEYKPIVMAISRSTKAYVSAINGAAAGVGAALAMACDLSVMAEDAYLLLPFAAMSLVPDGGTSWQLVNALGRKRAYEIILSGEKMSAQQCLDWGLVNRVVPGDELLAAAGSWAEALVEKAPLAMRYSKEALRFAQNHDLDATISFEAKLQNMTYQAEDVIEGVAARYEKRKPVFKGR